MNTDNTQDANEPSLASAGSQPVAYEVWWDGAARQPYFVSADEKPSGNWTPAPRIVPLYRKPHPTLTDEEREALEWAARAAAAWTNEACASPSTLTEVALSDRNARRYSDTLRGLRERLK